MRTVWILGAGASRAAYCGMPLVKDFMEEALHRMRFSGNQGKRVLDFLRESYGYEEPSDVNIEELLTLAWCDVSYLDGQGVSVLQDHERSERLYRAWDALRKVEALIVAVLFAAQQECLQRGDRVHDSLTEVIGTQDTIISYNYDLLVDRALWKVHRSSSDDYAVRFHGSVEGPGTSVRKEYVREPHVERCCTGASEGVPLLKLHGSLNWLGLASADLFTGDPEVFYLPEAASISIGPDFWWTPFYLRSTDGSNDISQSGRLRPIIVPPTFGKTAWKGTPMGKLWPQAQAALRNCDRVVIIGLSLREADYQTRWLLRTGLAVDRPRAEIDIVNTSLKDRDRLRRFFLYLGRVVEYGSVDKFLTGRTAA